MMMITNGIDDNFSSFFCVDKNFANFWFICKVFFFHDDLMILMAMTTDYW